MTDKRQWFYIGARVIALAELVIAVIGGISGKLENLEQAIALLVAFCTMALVELWEINAKMDEITHIEIDVNVEGEDDDMGTGGGQSA